MQLLRILWCILFFLTLCFNSNATSPLIPSLKLELAGHYSSGDHLPFWMFSNQNGKYNLNTSAFLTSLSASGYSDTTKNIEIYYGLETVFRTGKENNLWLQQGWVQTDFWDIIRLRGGRKEESIGFQYDDLSSGSILWSRNARPITRLELGSAGFVDVPYTNGFFQINGNLAHGWMEEGRFVENVLLHQKHFYMRFGGDKPLRFTLGVNHVALWGGTSPTLGNLPTDWDSYFRVFFIQQGNPENPDTPVSDVINIAGNSIGSRSYILDYNHNNIKTGIYFQDIFEDSSGGNYHNFPDGLWGIFMESKKEKPFIQSILYEYLQTTNQSGPIHFRGDMFLTGDDNYFNHGTYQSGWTQHKITIGTPFITSPIYQENIDHARNIRIWNNRVKVHHLGIEGWINFLSDIQYRILFSYSQNLGLHASTITVPDEFEFTRTKDQFSWLLDIVSALPVYEKVVLKFSVGGDNGEMYGNNFGGRLTMILNM